MPSALDHARALIRAGKDGTPPPSEAVAWAAGGLEMVIYQGVDPIRAMGLTGHSSPIRTTPKRQRDALLCDVRQRWFVGLDDDPAAAAILSALDRQTRARGRVTDELSRVLETLLAGKLPVPGRRHLRRILATK